MVKKEVNIESGVLLTNYDIDATGGGLWTDTTHYKVTVPAYKRWFLFGGNCYVTQNATCDVMLYNSDDKVINYLADYAAGTGHKPYPDGTFGAGLMRPIPLDAGEYIQATFGAAQDATAYATCRVLEVTYS